jgi:hypothetical protein
MELKQFSEELLVRMKSQIEKTTLDQPDALMRTSQIISGIEPIVDELKQYVLKYKFKSNNEEVEFFKSIKPIFISQLRFHKTLFKINLFESFNDPDARNNFYRKKMKSLQSFMIKHEQFYHYVLSNFAYLDDRYFVRANTRNKLLIQDERFSTGYDNLLSRILTSELLKDYLTNAINKINSAASTNLDNTLTWTGSKTDLIELIYALQASEAFNNGSADVKQIATHFENAFNVSLGNYYRVFQDIRLRKTNQLKFLDLLRQGMSKRIENIN